jgi:hypothetical protein
LLPLDCGDGERGGVFAFLDGVDAWESLDENSSE